MPKLRAPAKINLRLKITGRRPDGYHLLDMVMSRIDLCDEIDFELVKSGTELSEASPRATRNQSSIPTDHSNTLWKISDLVRKESRRDFGIRISLKKNIPIGAGLGGGSSDAATLLMGLNQELGLNWSTERMIDLGVRVGADIPFFLREGTQRVQGIGEVLESFPQEPKEVCLIYPGFSVSTREAYGWYDVDLQSSPLTKGGKGGFLKGFSALTGGGAGDTEPHLVNDLEKVVIPRYPVLARIKKLMVEAGALGALMSGSGSAVFGLFKSKASLDRGFDLVVSKKDPSWWLWQGNTLGN